MATIPIGFKVCIPGLEDHGWGEVASYPDRDGNVAVDFFRGPLAHQRVVSSTLQRTRVPDQTRCFLPQSHGFVMGRVIGCVDAAAAGPIIYHIAIPNESRARQLAETEFHVRSTLGTGDPVDTLVGLAHETPFFFDNRRSLVEVYDRFAQASRGLQALDSASVELFPHQAEAVRRVLQDPHIRYLLADEVGLGKTIEAGAILRQLEADAPSLRSLVLVPPVLRSQWEGELQRRFRLKRTLVDVHERVSEFSDQAFDVVVVDEAHRFIDGAGGGGRFDALRRLCESSKHILLLSATPILHRDAEILALLHLLDPDQYQLGDLDGFRRRVARRRVIGRLLLALDRASSPVVIRRQLELLKQELVDDQEVQAALADAPPDGGTDYTKEWRVLATRVRILVAETWRLHRRLVRSRRSALLEEGELRRVRNVEAPECASTYCDDPEAYSSLWGWIDELRTGAAAKAAQVAPNEAELLRKGYLEVAQAVSHPPPALSDLVDLMLKDPLWAFAADTLAKIQHVALQITALARLEALQAVLADPPEGESRWVVFCPNEHDAHRVSDYLSESFPRTRILTLVESDPSSAGPLMSEFSDCFEPVILVVDRIAEEGLNLQVADAVVLMDLPFHPLRLEQRIGRLDRLDRKKTLRAVAVLSQDDADDARQSFDRAWYEVLVQGLGLFSESIADVPYLLERQMDEMSRLVFERGPAALYDHVDTLRSALAAERTAAEEQAIIDGTSVAGIRNAEWWKALEEADASEQMLADAFQRYVVNTLGLRMETQAVHHANAGLGAFLLKRDRSRDILLPANLLVPLAELIRGPFTFSRRVATKADGVELLRPGCEMLDWLRELADWDDRGRAFALWRRVPEWLDARVIVRVCVVAELDSSLEFKNGALDDVGRAALHRLAGGWFAPWRMECFLQPDGSPADEAQISVCLLPYDKRHDVNLGGERTSALLHVVGAGQTWPSMCRRLANMALEQTGKHPEFSRRLSKAQTDAQAWFAQRHTRLTLRQRQGIAANVAQEREWLELQSRHVDALLAVPKLRVDAIGLYVLCAHAPQEW